MTEKKAPEDDMMKPASLEAERTPRMVAPLRDRRLLIVDDDRDLAAVFRRIAQEVDPDLVVDWASSVPEAVHQLERQPYDLVLCDYLLDANGSGFALRGWIERQRPNTPFAMMSSVSTDRYLDCSGPAPRPFLAKPFTVPECREFLAAMLM